MWYLRSVALCMRATRTALPTALFALAACGVITYATAASAHAPPYGAGVAFDPTHPDRVVVNTNRGLLVSMDGGEAWTFLCADALGYATQEPPAYAVTSSGGVVLATDVGLVQTTPDLCSVSVSDDVDPTMRTHWISATTEEAPRAYAAVGELSPGSAVYLQDGNSGSWTKQGDLTDVLLQRVVASPADADVLYGSGVGADGERLFGRSMDGGSTWILDPYPLLDDEVGIFAIGSSPADTERAFALVRKNGSMTPDRMLLSTDGGGTFDVVTEQVGITSFAISEDGETVWVGSLEGVWRSKDGGATFSQVGSVTGVTCLAAREDELWICGRPTPLSLAVLKSSDGGETFNVALAFPDVQGPIDCPKDSFVAATCATLWTDWQIEMELAAAASTGSADGGGCALGGAYRASAPPSLPGTQAWLWLGLLTLCGLRGGLLFRRLSTGR